MRLWDVMRERLTAAWRAFVLGPAVVEPSDRAWGHDSSPYSPPEYGNYIATSNAVYACATLRAQLLASLPLKLYTLNARGERAEVTSGPLYALLQKVNPFWTFNRLVEMSELSLCLWGQCFWFLERGEGGTSQPREIWWGRPDRVRVVPHPTDYIEKYIYLPMNALQPLEFQPSEVIWFRFPNPLDEFAPLSPLAAARLSADYATDAMQANRKLFNNGMHVGGAIMPKAGTELTADQANDIEERISRRLKGLDKWHRWAVLRFEAQLQNMEGFTPKEAEFLGGLAWSLEEVARAYKVPLDLIGGQRTYENVDAAHKAIWTHCIVPEARFISTDITEQLLPMFPGQAALAEHDLSGVEVLREQEAAEWARADQQIARGALTINEWRTKKGQQPVPWGDAWWAPLGAVPITAATPPALPAPAEESGGAEAARPAATRQARAVEYGSDEHQRLLRRFASRTEKQEKKFGKVVAELFKRQKDAVLARLRARAAATPETVLAGSPTGRREIGDEPFDLAEWIKKFRTEARPSLREILQEAGDAALEDLGLTLAFDVSQAPVVRFLEKRAQRFAREVCETTWNDLKAALAEGVDAGESVDQLADRVESIMGERIQSSAETIARTEVIGASNGGALEAWKQSEVVEAKAWLAALDDRTRDTHREAHGQQVALDEDFVVGDARGPAPGQMGDAGEDINCRCTMTAVLSERLYRARFGQNGHRKERVYA